MACILLTDIWKIILHTCYKHVSMHMKFGASCSNSGAHRWEVSAKNFLAKILQNKTNSKCPFIINFPPRGPLINVITMHKKIIIKLEDLIK